MARLSYRIVLELDKKDPIIFDRDMGLKGVVNQALVGEAMAEVRQAVDRDLREYMIKNRDIFEEPLKRVMQIMTPGGPQDAIVRKGDGTGTRR